MSTAVSKEECSKCETKRRESKRPGESRKRAADERVVGAADNAQHDPNSRGQHSRTNVRNGGERNGGEKDESDINVHLTARRSQINPSKNMSQSLFLWGFLLTVHQAEMDAQYIGVVPCYDWVICSSDCVPIIL